MRRKRIQPCPNSLPGLPVEIIDKLCSYGLAGVNLRTRRLAATSLRTLRLVCQALKEKVDQRFAKHYFSDIGINLDHDSLSRLLNVATHPTFSRELRTLRILPMYMYSSEFDKGLYDIRPHLNITTRDSIHADSYEGDSAEDARLKSAQLLHQWKFDSQKRFLQGDMDLKLLTVAFGALKNLNSVVVGSTRVAPERERIDPETGQRCCVTDGWLEGSSYGSEVSAITHATCTLLRALVMSDMRLGKLHVGIPATSISVKPTVVNICTVAQNETYVGEAFRQLRELTLYYRTGHERAQCRENCAMQSAKAHLSSILRRMDKLEQLTLIDADTFHEDSRLCLSQALEDMRPSTLRDLRLTNVSCTADALQRFFIRHRRSLRSVDLLRVHLPEHNDWQTVIQAMLDCESPFEMSELSLRWLSAGKRTVTFDYKHGDKCRTCRLGERESDLYSDCHHICLRIRGRENMRPELEKMLPNIAVYERSSERDDDARNDASTDEASDYEASDDSQTAIAALSP